MQVVNRLLESIRQRGERRNRINQITSTQSFNPQGERRKKREGRRKLLLIVATLGVGLLAGIIGFLLYGQSVCTPFTRAVLGGSIAVIAAVLIVLIVSRPVAKVSGVGFAMRLVVMFVAPIAVTAFAAVVLSPISEIRRTFCSCDLAEDARAQRLNGFYDDAIGIARACLRTASDNACSCDCTYELAQALYDKANNEMPAAPVTSADQCPNCSSVDAQLAEAAQLAQTCNIPRILGEAITNERALLGAYCVQCTAMPTPTATHTPEATSIPTDTPTPIASSLDIFRVTTQPSTLEIAVDFRVYQGSEHIPGLDADRFELLTGSDTPISGARFEERTADDNVCVILLIDNSASVVDGVDEIKEAVSTLNSTKKPNDELGMIVFDALTNIYETPPSTANLNTDRINGTGRYTAVWTAVERGLELANQCQAPLRYLFLLSDGLDTAGRDGVVEAPNMANRAEDMGVSICSIGLPSNVLQEEMLRNVSYGCGYTYAENYDVVASTFVSIFGAVRDFYRFILPANTLNPGDIVKVTLKPSGPEDTYVYQR